MGNRTFSIFSRKKLRLCFTYVTVETFKGPVSSKALSSVLKTQLHGPTTAPITVSVSIWKFSCIK